MKDVEVPAVTSTVEKGAVVSSTLVDENILSVLDFDLKTSIRVVVEAFVISGCSIREGEVSNSVFWKILYLNFILIQREQFITTF